MKYHQKCDQNPLCVSSVLHNGVSSVVDQDYIVRSLVKTYVKKRLLLSLFCTYFVNRKISRSIIQNFTKIILIKREFV